MKVKISLEISSAGYSETRSHIPQKQSRHLQLRMINISPIQKRKKFLVQLKKKNVSSSKTEWCSVFSVGQFTKL
jgi:hypothetical protein